MGSSTIIIVVLLCCAVCVATLTVIYFTNVACDWGMGSWAGYSCPITPDGASSTSIATQPSTTPNSTTRSAPTPVPTPTPTPTPTRLLR